MSLVWLAGIQTAVRGQECLPDNMKCGKLYVMYIVIDDVSTYNCLHKFGHRELVFAIF